MIKYPVIDIKGRKLVQGTPRTEKLKHSSFGITFNTNYRPKDKKEAELLDEQLYNALAETFSKLDKCLRVVDSIRRNPENGKSEYTTHKMTAEEFDEHIKHVKIRFHNEMGPKLLRIHTHAYIYIMHTSRIHLDFDEIMKELQNQCSMRGIPIVKYGHLTIEKPGMKEYMMKTKYQ